MARANPLSLTPELSPSPTFEGASLAFDRAEATDGAAAAAAAGGTSDFGSPSFSGGCFATPDSALPFEAFAVEGASPSFSSWGDLDAGGAGACGCAPACACAAAAAAPSSFKTRL